MTTSPGHQLDVLLVHLESFYNLDTSQANLGVLYVATTLEQQGFSVKLMSTTDVFFLNEENMQTIFANMRPRLVGFYTLSDNIYQVSTLAGRVHQWSPSSKLLCGGPLASALSDRLSSYYPFDFIIKGEGEYSTTALVRYLKTKQGQLSDIAGLSYTLDQGKTYQHGPSAQPIKDLDQLPNPDRSLVPRSLRLNISAGRGCPNACTFCFQAVHGKGYRFRSAENLAAEIIANLEQYPYRAFDIIDDTFVADADRAFRFCEILRDYRSTSHRDFAWYCEARVDTLDLHPDLLIALTETGLIRLQVGIESGDSETLRRYGKRLDLDALENLVGRVNQMGNLSIFGNFIIGGPFENEQTLQRSRQLALRLIDLAPGLFEATSGYLAPFPETPLAQRAEQFGLTNFEPEFLTSLTLDECTCETPTMSRAQIRRARFLFTQQLLKRMVHMLPKLPKERILQHYHWLHKYGTATRWLSNIFQRLGAVNEYFKFYDSPRFCSLDSVPEQQLPRYTAMRTIGPLQYDPANWEEFLLDNSYRKLRLHTRVEKEVYALSAGKLTLEQMSLAIKQRLDLPDSPTAILHQQIVPALRKLEKHFQVILHQ